LLRKYELAKLPFEEIYHRFQQSNEVEPPTTLFAQETSRAFGALFGMYAPCKETRIVYVQFNDNIPNMAFSKEHNILYVHEKWLHFWRAHRTSPCEISELGDAPSDIFCDHVVDDMFKSAVLAVWRPIAPPYNIMVKDVQSLQSLIRKCKGKTREMPFKVQITTGAQTDSLRVTWKDNYNRAFAERLAASVNYFVVLHGAACILEAYRLWYREHCLTCDCPRQIVQLAPNGTDNVAVFENLDNKPRFPMVARCRQPSDEPSLWGLPPSPVSPISSLIEDGPNEPILDERFSLDDESSESSETYSPVLKISYDDSESPNALPKSPGRVVEMATGYEHYSTRMAALKTQSLAGVQAMLESLRVDDSILIATVCDSTALPRSSQVQSGQYLRVPTDPPGSSWIIYVHDVVDVDNSIRLLVTKYSPLSEFWSDDDTIFESINRREVLLHFNDFDHMGEREDADWVVMDDILGFCSTDRIVHHVTEKPGKRKQACWIID
jgi:hypothetical protein